MILILIWRLILMRGTGKVNAIKHIPKMELTSLWRIVNEPC